MIDGEVDAGADNHPPDAYRPSARIIALGKGHAITDVRCRSLSFADLRNIIPIIGTPTNWPLFICFEQRSDCIL
jgi:hypothetical protein